MKRDTQPRARGALRRLIPFAAVLTLTLTVCWFGMDRASALYILTDEEDATIVLEDAAAAADLSSQTVFVANGIRGVELKLAAGQPVTVRYGGAALSTTSQEETVSQLLSRLHVTPGPLDMIAVDMDGGALMLNVSSDLTYYERAEETDPFQTLYVDDPTMEAGTQKTVQEGANGTRTAVYEVRYSGGERVSRQLVSEENATAVDQIIHIGTAVPAKAAAVSAGAGGIADISKNADGSGTLTLTSGETLAFTAVKSMTATAYTKGYGGADGCTATGTSVRVGVVAVDKRVIPLGTRMYIVSADGKVTYGVAVAEDTGVRGNVVDLYYDTYQECISFGRRAATVYILA